MSDSLAWQVGTLDSHSSRGGGINWVEQKLKFGNVCSFLGLCEGFTLEMASFGEEIEVEVEVPAEATHKAPLILNQTTNINFERACNPMAH